MWASAPGVVSPAERAAVRARLHAHAAGLALLPPDVKTEADALVCRDDRGLRLEPHDDATLARHRAEWRRNALPGSHVEPPVVRADRIAPTGRGRVPLLAIRCPFCAEEHYHGAGRNPGDGDGHRLAHCDRGGVGAGYVLREARP